MTHVLRKSVAGFSAGTAVEVVSEQHSNYVDKRDTRLTWLPGATEAIDCEVVKLRSRSDLVPANNRAKRRAHKIAEYKLLKDLGAI